MTFLVIATLATLSVLLLGVPAVLFALMVETARERDGVGSADGSVVLPAAQLPLAVRVQVAA